MKSNIVVDGSGPGLPNVHQVIGILRERYGFSRTHVDMILKLAAERPSQAREWKLPDGYITIRYNGLSRFSIGDFTDNPAGKVAVINEAGYTQEETMPSKYSSAKATTMRRHREAIMPGRPKRQAPEPEPEATEQDDQGNQIERYLSKPLSPTHVDFVTWFTDNVADPKELEPDRLMSVTLYVYGMFQKSDFNREQKALRREARGAVDGDEPAAEEAPAPAPAARRGRGRPSAQSQEQAAPVATPRRGRGRPAATGAKAPY